MIGFDVSFNLLIISALNLSMFFFEMIQIMLSAIVLYL
jgi:hypothetical protein